MGRGRGCGGCVGGRFRVGDELDMHIMGLGISSKVFGWEGNVHA